MEYEGRNKGEREEDMVKVGKGLDFDYAVSDKALAKSPRRWWQGFSPLHFIPIKRPLVKRYRRVVLPSE